MCQNNKLNRNTFDSQSMSKGKDTDYMDRDQLRKRD